MESKYFLRQINNRTAFLVGTVLIILSAVCIYLYINNSIILNNLFELVITVAIFTILGIVCIVFDLLNKKNTKKLLKEYNLEQLLREIDSEDTISDHKAKIYLTKNNIISYKAKINIINYKDIVWIYPKKDNSNGLFIVIVNNQGMKYVINYIYSDGVDEDFNKFYAKLRNRLPHSLYGYTEENKSKANDVIERYKKILQTY